MPMHFAIFPVHVSKVLRLPRKSDARSYEVLHLSRKKHMLQNAPLLRKSTPSSPNASNSCVSCSALAMRNASFQILFKCPTPAIVFETATNPHVFNSLLTRCRIPCACHAKRHPNVQKCSVPPSFFCTFVFEMCFAPQRHGLFRHVNSKVV